MKGEILLYVLAASIALSSVEGGGQALQKAVVTDHNRLVRRSQREVQFAAATPQSLKSGGLSKTPNMKIRALSIVIPWLYFMAVNMNLPNLPKYINFIVNKGSLKSSKKSAIVYGNLSSFDMLFTFLSVNAVGCLSDTFGRKPFIMYSATGLALAYFLTSLTTTADNAWLFYLSGSIDGMSSCMFSQAQAYASDLSLLYSESVSISLGQFQGLAIGCAFMLGIPLGGYLGAKYSLKAPLYCAIASCALCAFLTYLVLPESVNLSKAPPIDLKKANPLGALKVILSRKAITVLSAVYCLINIAQAGVLIIWVNYLENRFGWRATQSSFTLAIVGVTVAIFPRLIIPKLGIVAVVQYGLLLHAAAIVAMGLTSKDFILYAVMPFFAMGASTLPSLLGLITDQVSEAEVGSIQGAAETVRTVSSMFGYILISRVFGHLIDIENPYPQGALFLSSVFSLVGFFIFSFYRKYFDGLPENSAL